MGNSIPNQACGTNVAENKNRRQPKREWRGALTSALMGVAGGMAINDLSGTLGYRGLTGVFALAGVLAATNWLRKLDPRAPLARYASWLFLTPAAAAAIVAAFSPGRIEGIFTATAVILTTGAIFLSTGIEAGAGLLQRAAVIGIGVAGIGFGVALLADRETLFGVTLIAGGFAGIGLGVAWLEDRQTLWGVAVIGFGVAGIGLGVAWLEDRQTLPE